MDELVQAQTVEIFFEQPSPKEDLNFQSQNSWYMLSNRIFDSDNKNYCLNKILNDTNHPEKGYRHSVKNNEIYKLPWSYPVKTLYPLLKTPIDIKCPEKDFKLRLLEKILNDAPDDETAWVWLSMATDATERKILYLKNVLQINPDNEIAEQTLWGLNDPNKITKNDMRIIGIPARSQEFKISWEKIAVTAVIIITIMIILSFALIGFLINKSM